MAATTDPNDADAWRDRYLQAQTGWDLGGANEGLLLELTSRYPRTAKILVPGAGRGYEAAWLWERGYTQVYVCDWVADAFETLRSCPYLPHENRLIVGDFFTLSGTYDALLEQTFFCAIEPSARPSYVRQAWELLRFGGSVIGVLFDRDFAGGPPYGGSAAEYRALFSQHFGELEVVPFANSVKPRQGTEVLVVARKVNRLL